MSSKSFAARCVNLFVFSMAIVFAGNAMVFGQTMAPAPAVNPIVDPLSEMTPSPAGETDDGILDMDIEKLSSVDAVVPTFDIEVSSVTKQESTIGKSPAAVYVITSEMIQRSGATCIPEVLRIAPGVQVARLSSSAWSVSIRGFNDRYTNKLLVLVDGRSVYSPILSGVFWDMLDMPLEDIERIEIIRGPGGTLWGANAVNGIINIISKKAKDTQGAMVSVGGGSQAYNINTVRYGGQLGKNTKFRVWGKNVDYGPEDSPGRYDDWRNGRGGFYADWNPRGSKADLVTIQGNFYSGKEGVRLSLLPDTFAPPAETITDRRVAENSFLARWTHTYDDESDWTLQTYVDQTCRYDPQAGLEVNTFDIDFQYRRPIGNRHSLITGVEYRQVHDFLRMPSLSLQFNPSSRYYDTTSGFVQDEIELVDDKFYLTFGSKFEGNSFTGFEYQPSIRGLWTIDNRHVVWGAISRAVRTPSRFDEDAISTQYWAPAPPTYAVLYGNHNIESENVVAYELGYRAQPSDRFAWDLAVFYNNYQNLMAYLQGTPYWDPVHSCMIVPFSLENIGNGQSYGGELTASWQATKNWKLAGSYSFLVCYDHFFNSTGGYLTRTIGGAATDSRNQVRLQSYWNFAPHWQLDCFLRYVDELPHIGLPGVQGAPSYITMDIRLGWKASKDLEIAIVGQNLFAPHHKEFEPYPQYGEPRVEINRAVFAKLTWTR